MRLRLDGDDLLDLRRVVAEVQAVPGAHLDDPTAQSGEQPLAMVGLTLPSAEALMRAYTRAKSGWRTASGLVTVAPVCSPPPSGGGPRSCLQRNELR